MTYLAATSTTSGGNARGRGIFLNEVNSLSLSNNIKNFDNITIELDVDSKAYWCFMHPQGKPIYTHALMRDITNMQQDLSALFANLGPSEARPVEWFVLASSTPGIFNLGGDLAHFAARIQARDLKALRHYGHVAVEAIHRNTVAFDLPIVTIALVQGDALGGGFEHALSCDLIVAERSAKFGLPEILFNMFPGMGAYSFLSRRLDRARAHALIMSGRIHTAEELFAIGVVDVLAEDGQGEEAVCEYIAHNRRKHNAHYACNQARRCIDPVTLEELRNVVNVWAEAAINLTPADLRKMARLTSAQDRRLAALNVTLPGTTPEIPVAAWPDVEPRIRMGAALNR